jgi:glycosyltransferase involved in cell wall biosynthesis
LTEIYEAPIKSTSELSTKSKYSKVDAVEPRPIAPYETEFPDLTQFINRVKGPGRNLRVCIATEDIVGPIPNGGIGTTYTHLSRLLADAGHDVVIAYLRGSYCQKGSIKKWVDWYKTFGVTFEPLDPDEVELDCPAPRWIKPMYSLYRYLKRESFDVVHVSEWRGSAFLSLLAKKQGLAFSKTIFCIKASSPWLWNREYGYHTIDRMDDLPKIFAEKRSIELADLIISGSRYMLCWMLEHGYKLIEGRAYVQPNVLVPLDLDKLAVQRRQTVGTRVNIDEIVFFGRLEYRKGLEIFIEAIQRLVVKKVPLPKITLMGKIGEKIPSYPDLTIPEYIKEKTREWPVNVKTLNNFGTEEALRYLLGGNRLAVMPSIIENSTLAVYEAAYFRIPCIASDRGGTSELIAPEHCEHVLTEPEPVALAGRLETALSDGGFVPEPSFDNDRNLDVWLRFHEMMGAYVQDLGNHSRDQEIPTLPKVSICLAANEKPEYIQELILRLADRVDGNSAEFVIAINGSIKDDGLRWMEELQENQSNIRIVEARDGSGEQYAQNQAAASATGELLVFTETGTLLKPEFIEVVQHVASSSDAAVFGCFYEKVRQIEDIDKGRNTSRAVFIEDHTFAFYNLDNMSPVITIRKQAFEALGGFRMDWKVPGAIHELVLSAKLKNLQVETIPESIAWHVESFAVHKRLNYKAQAYRSIRPFLENAPQCYKRILMRARNASGDNQNAGGAGLVAARDPIGTIEEKARKAAREAGSSPMLRSFGWKLYYFQIRLFRKMVAIEIKVFKMILDFKNKLVQKQLTRKQQ